jgi:hypothetical protein
MKNRTLGLKHGTEIITIPPDESPVSLSFFPHWQAIYPCHFKKGLCHLSICISTVFAGEMD